MKVTVEIKIDISAHLKKLEDNTFRTYTANEWYRLYTPWVPMDTGALSQSVDIRPYEIAHTVPYARRMYEGTHMNFRRDKHPLASAKWDQAAKPSQESKLISAVQSYIDSGRLGLSK